MIYQLIFDNDKFGEKIYRIPCARVVKLFFVCLFVVVRC